MHISEIANHRDDCPIITFANGRRLALGITDILYNTNEFECISKDNTVRVFKNEITLDELRKSGETSKFNADDVIMIES